ncbi:MAG: choice-of-anchor D domain-containing protein [Deltaproteobacteria bacterium]|nr:choice-of-anchor D domain-containing protein [Deltaproteobacteria bacterium]
MSLTLLASMPLTACDCGGDGLRGLAPAIIAEPSPLPFGQVALGTTGRRALTIRNAGEAVLNVTSLAILPTSDPAFSIESVADFELAVGAERTIEVRYAPAQEGSRTGVLQITSNDPNTPILDVPLVAEGVLRSGPAIVVCVSSSVIPLAESCADPLAIDFGSRAFGARIDAQIRIRSIGTEPLQVTSAKVQPGGHPSFTFDPTDVISTLNPGDSVDVRVTFATTTFGPVSAAFAVESNDPTRDWVPVTLTALGLAPAVCAQPSFVDFGVVAVGQTAEKSIELESCGDADLVLSELLVPASEFALLDPLSAPLTLPPGQKHAVRLTYAPTAAGRDSGQLILRSNLPEGAIALSGAGAGCDLDTTPRSLTFGTVGQGRSRTLSTILTNIGAIDCDISSIALGTGTSNEFVPAARTQPFALAPGATESIQVTYTPAGSGDDMGSLELRGSDPDEPTISVALDGRAAGPGECVLDARPSPVAFGSVSLGSQRTITVTLENVGSSLCTIGALKLSATTDRSFVLSPPGLPAFVPSGATRTVDISFSPSITGPATGEMEVYGLIPLRPNIVVPLSGNGSGPKLCVDPDPIVFGTQPVGTVVSRTAQLSACGTEDVVVSSVSLPAPTSTEFALPTPPGTLTIPVGTIQTVDLRFTATNPGREDGVLRLVSNDALTPTYDVSLIAAASNGPCGDLTGKICGVGGLGPIAGARVRVDTGAGPIETVTDEAGDFVLTCLPPGNVDVIASSGSWSTSFSATVDAYAVTSVPGQQCLDSNSAKIAVVWGQWDQFQSILDELNIPYTLIGDSMFSDASELILDPAELATYDIVFFNCGFDENVATSNAGLTNLRNFVTNGGSVYASDWAYDVIEMGWPSHNDFHGDDAVQDAAQNAGNHSGPAAVVDPSLSASLRATQVTISSCCTAIDSAASGTTIYLQSDRYDDGGTHPLMTSFAPSPGAGRVFYTDFHNSDQVGILDVFRWLINQL